MKVTYFSKYSRTGPSSRYRIFQYEKYFHEAGVHLEIHPLFDEQYLDQILREGAGRGRKSIYTLKRFSLRRSQLARTKDSLVVVEHQLFPYIPFFIERLLLPERYVIEFDDAIYLTHPAKMPFVLKNAAGVIAGNDYLAGYAIRYNSRVHVVPTVIDTDHFVPQAKRSPKERPTVGWIGLEYNYKFLKQLTPVFQKLGSTTEILILSGSPPRDFEFAFRFEKWDEGREVEQISQMDIGLMPLEFDEWSKGKCGMKLLQYMSLEIPAIATPVGVNLQIIRDGKNGFTAVSPDEWETKIRTLLEQSDLRNRIGKEARRTVEDNYSIHRWFPELLRIYRQFT